MDDRSNESQISVAKNYRLSRMCIKYPRQENVASKLAVVGLYVVENHVESQQIYIAKVLYSPVMQVITYFTQFPDRKPKKTSAVENSCSISRSFSEKLSCFSDL